MPALSTGGAMAACMPDPEREREDEAERRWPRPRLGDRCGELGGRAAAGVEAVRAWRALRGAGGAEAGACAALALAPAPAPERWRRWRSPICAWWVEEGKRDGSRALPPIRPPGRAPPSWPRRRAPAGDSVTWPRLAQPLCLETTRSRRLCYVPRSVSVFQWYVSDPPVGCRRSPSVQGHHRPPAWPSAWPPAWPSAWPSALPPAQEHTPSVAGAIFNLFAPSLAARIGTSRWRRLGLTVRATPRRPHRWHATARRVRSVRSDRGPGRRSYPLAAGAAQTRSSSQVFTERGPAGMQHSSG